MNGKLWRPWGIGNAVDPVGRSDRLSSDSLPATAALDSSQKWTSNAQARQAHSIVENRTLLLRTARCCWEPLDR